MTVEGTKPAPLYKYFQSIFQRHPELMLPETEEVLRWPMYAYSRGTNNELNSILQMLAESLNSEYFKSMDDDLPHVNALLNTTPHNALSSGIIWIREEQAKTPNVRRVGITFHPMLCNANLFLMHPVEWQQLLYRVFPLMRLDAGDASTLTPSLEAERRGRLEYDDANRMVTLTCDVDKADYSMMTPEMRRNVLRMERGIESGQPQHTPISSEAQAMISEDFQRTRHIIPFKFDAGKRILHAFMTDVEDLELRGEVQRFTQAEVKVYYMEPEDEDAYWMLRGVSAFAAHQEEARLREELLGMLNSE